MPRAPRPRRLAAHQPARLEAVAVARLVRLPRDPLPAAALDLHELRVPRRRGRAVDLAKLEAQVGAGLLVDPGLWFLLCPDHDEFDRGVRRSTRRNAAFVEELPGVNAQSASIDEARDNLQEAIEFTLEANRTLAEDALAGKQVIRQNLVAG